jgi:hypothetical protein
VWNAVTIGTVAGFTVSAWLIVGLAGVIVLLLLSARLIPRTILAGVQTVIQEGHAQANELLPPEWSPSDYGLGWRLMGSHPISGPPAYPQRSVPAVPVSQPGDDLLAQRIEDDLKSE